MKLPVDGDLAVFVYTVGRVVFTALPQLRLSVPKVPVHYQIEEVAASALTDRQAAIFAPYDEKLAAMSYWPVCTYRVANYGHNLMRTYVNSAETSRCVVMIVELNLNVAGKRPVSSTCLLSFHTRFTDDTILTTRNMQLKSVLDCPSYQTIQERPRISDPAEMKRVHDAKVASMGCPVPPPASATQVFKDVNEEHDRFCQYQLSQGTFHPDPDGTTYSLADKAHWRGVRNHFNPFVHRFHPLRFIPAALVAMFLPVLAALNLAPAAAAAAQNMGFPPDTAFRAMMLACYLVAGATVGLLLEHGAFLWVFLLTYIPIRIFAPAALGPMPYSAFAGAVAYAVAQARAHKRAVLLPQRAR